MSLTAHSDPKKSNKLYHFTRRAEERATIPGSVREFRLVESVAKGLGTVRNVSTVGTKNGRVFHSRPRRSLGMGNVDDSQAMSALRSSFVLDTFRYSLCYDLDAIVSVRIGTIRVDSRSYKNRKYIRKIERSVEEKHVRGRYRWNASTSINGLVSWSIWESVSPEVAKILTIKESEKEKEEKKEEEKDCFTRECLGTCSHPVGRYLLDIVIIGEAIERGCVCEHGTKIRVKFYEEGLSNSRGRGFRRSSTREVKRSSIGSPGWIIKATNDILREVEEKKKEKEKEEEEEEEEWRLFSGQLNRSHGIAPWERLQESENLNLLVSRTSCDRRKSMSPHCGKKN
uniref:Uncharacterized protein n=1 Tax=Vespula pensylvanica TaxID=30213 RepID=A0A834U8I3_VESPE|nr:hypothetical protein H0235_009488 [Vespula pensylvanica]